MVNGPMGGFMPTPAAPAQPPTVKLDTTALSRGNFNNFLKNMSGASSLNPPMAPQMGAMMSPSLAPSISDIDIFNPPMQMMQQGGNVAPRQTEIMGQPHMLAYITPQESDILEGLGGANEPGPMGIPSFFDAGEGSGGYGSDDSATGGDDGSDNNNDYGGGYQDDAQATDPGFDTSPPDDDMDYTDPDYGYTTQDTDTGQDDFDRATEIGQQVAADQAAQAAANEVISRNLARQRQNQQSINQAIANQQKGKDGVTQSVVDTTKSDTTTTQPSLSSAMTGRGGTTAAANIAAGIGIVD